MVAAVNRLCYCQLLCLRFFLSEEVSFILELKVNGFMEYVSNLDYAHLRLMLRHLDHILISSVNPYHFFITCIN